MLLISILQQTTLQFNTNYQLSDNGGQLSSDSGLLLVKEFMKKINFDQMIEDTLHFYNLCLYCKYDQLQFFQQCLLQLIVGYENDCAANSLRHNPLFTHVFNLAASQPTLSRFINVKNEQDNQNLHHLVTQLAEKMIIDIDSAHSDIFGNQDGSEYNAHYGTTSYHPIIATDLATKTILSVQLHPGSVYTSNGQNPF